MRKSTLITTIAMIVVVVVALSTATFAWFSSSSVTEATQTITTDTSGDLLISVGTIQDTGLIEFSPATADTMTIDTAFNGLFSPVAALDRAVDSTKATGAKIVDKDNLTTAVTDKELFVQALQGKNAIYEKSINKDPLVLSVLNAATEAKPVILTVVIDLGATTPTNNNKVAAAALSFNILATTGTTPTVSQFTNGYSITNPETAYTSKTTVLTENTDARVPLTAVTYGPTGTGALTTKLTADSVLNSETWMTSATASNASVPKKTEGQKLLIYRMVLASSLNSAERINLTLYSWMDGWVAPDGARNASFSISYIFSTGAYAA